MKSLISASRKVVVIIVGIPIIILGVILIPLPGPGLLVMALGLFILASEFDWAKKYLDQIKHQIKKITDLSRQAANKDNKKSDKTK